MDETLLQVIAICAVFGLIFGPLTARSSHRQQAITGGPVAQFFHLLASMTFVAILPGVLVSVLLGGGLRMGLPLGIVLFISSFLLLLVYAAFEPDATS